MLIQSTDLINKCQKLTIIAQLSNYYRTYLNKSSGSATYKGDLLLIFTNKDKKDQYQSLIISWCNNYFKYFIQKTSQDNEIYLKNIRYSAGSGYNVWNYAILDLAKYLNIKIKLDYCN